MAWGSERGTRGEKERGDEAMVKGWGERERGETTGGLCVPAKMGMTPSRTPNGGADYCY